MIQRSWCRVRVRRAAEPPRRWVGRLVGAWRAGRTCRELGWSTSWSKAGQNIDRSPVGGW